MSADDTARQADQGRDDGALMAAYALGDAKAFEALYARHKGVVYRYLLSAVKDPAIAAELFQDVWARVIENRGRYTDSSAFTHWLLRIAHNRVVDHWRRVPPPAEPIDDLDSGQLPSSESDTPERIADDQRAALLHRLIARLPPEQREAITLRLERNLTAEAIAAIQGASKEAVKSRLRYAMAKLREALGDD